MSVLRWGWQVPSPGGSVPGRATPPWASSTAARGCGLQQRRPQEEENGNLMEQR